jgi:uncharacterized protein YbaR (Trm112 family)
MSKLLWEDRSLPPAGDPTGEGRMTDVRMTRSLPPALCALLRCPRCGAELTAEEQALRCLGAACGMQFPIVQGIPVLIDPTQASMRHLRHRLR